MKAQITVKKVDDGAQVVLVVEQQSFHVGPTYRREDDWTAEEQASRMAEWLLEAIKNLGAAVEIVPIESFGERWL